MIKPMLFGTAKMEDVEQFVTDPDVVFEQKLDGARLMVVIERGLVSFHNRRGDAMKHTASTQWFNALRDDLAGVVEHVGPHGNATLDGELMHDTGTYYVFDLPEFDRGEGTVPRVRASHPFFHRREALNELATHFGPSVRRVSQYVTEGAKRALVERVRAEEGEGVIAKSRDAGYAPGQRVKHSLKVKIVRSVDVVVTKVDRPDPRHGSIEFGLYATPDAELPTFLGSCSAIGKPEVHPFDVIEIQYLGWVPGGGLREPRMVRVRDDKRARECTADQLKAYSKAVL